LQRSVGCNERLIPDCHSSNEPQPPTLPTSARQYQIEFRNGVVLVLCITELGHFSFGKIEIYRLQRVSR
jgi:hypothetical protein